jgi:hypothetical protein
MFRDTIALLLLLGWVAVLPSCTDRNSASGREIAGKSPNSPLGATKDAPKDNKAPVPGDLEKLEQSFVLAIKAKDTEAFLRLVSDGGMYLGVDAEKSSKKAIANQIGARKGVYCLLFESACLRAETRRDTCSYSQLLSDGDEEHTSTTLGNFDNRAQAELTVMVRNDKCNSGPESLSFIFNHEPSGWKLVAIPYT